ncbi:MAG TPA: prolyl oligopeptidase family serine peptidase, partial [Steroidobacteraceae bacterium]|nr:prolyl oligopeptidase family serine peptidase [Steroidobacteraceae bacterium]
MRCWQRVYMGVHSSAKFAAIRQLAAAHSFMDCDRVGIYGHSFGGYSSMEGILRYGDVFKVAASSAGPYDLYGQYPMDAFFAPSTYKSGARSPTGPADYPRNWGDFDLTRDADSRCAARGDRSGGQLRSR